MSEEKEFLEFNKALNQKIVDISNDIGAMQKDGHNKFSGYDFISAEAMLTACRNKFKTHNFNIIPEIVEVKESTSQSQQGKSTIRTIVKCNFELVDLETGFSKIISWYGADQDTGGKSMGQAITDAYKRFTFKLFNISTGEPDTDHKTVETKPEPTKKKVVTPEKEVGNLIQAEMKRLKVDAEFFQKTYSKSGKDMSLKELQDSLTGLKLLTYEDVHGQAEVK